MKLWEVSFLSGYHGMQDSVIVEAVDNEEAENVFQHHFPKKIGYVFDVKEFNHNPAWMKPLEEMTIYRKPA